MFGYILLGVSLYYLGFIIPKMMFDLLFVGLGIYFVVQMTFIEKITGIKKIVPIIIFLAAISFWGWAKLGQNTNLKTYSKASFEIYKTSQTPVILDFYSDWCVPCREMDMFTFRNPEVAKRIEIIPVLKVNVSDENVDELTKKHRIMGVPTLVFFDKNGNERKKLRVEGFVSAKEFLERVKELESGK